MQIDKDKLTPEMKAKFKKIMKETALPLSHIPTKLFHATPIRNFRGIEDNGLQPSEIYGEIYFCEKQKECLKFVKKPCIIYEVDPNKLDMEEMFLSREAKQWQAFQYYGQVPKDALKGWKTFS